MTQQRRVRCSLQSASRPFYDLVQAMAETDMIAIVEKVYKLKNEANMMALFPNMDEDEPWVRRFPHHLQRLFTNGFSRFIRFAIRLRTFHYAVTESRRDRLAVRAGLRSDRAEAAQLRDEAIVEGAERRHGRSAGVPRTAGRVRSPDWTIPTLHSSFTLLRLSISSGISRDLFFFYFPTALTRRETTDTCRNACRIPERNTCGTCYQLALSIRISHCRRSTRR